MAPDSAKLSDRLWIVMAGVAESDKQQFTVGSTIGEAGFQTLLMTPSRNSSKMVSRDAVFARSDLFLLEIMNKDLLNLIPKASRKSVEEELAKFNGVPNDLRWNTLQGNKMLLSALVAQLGVHSFMAILDEPPLRFSDKEVLQEGRGRDTVKNVYLIVSGGIKVIPMVDVKSYRGFQNKEDERPIEVHEGGFVGDMNALIKGEPSKYRFTCVGDTQVLVCQQEALLAFLNKNPGLKFQFIDKCSFGNWTTSHDVLDTFGGLTMNVDSPF